MCSDVEEDCPSHSFRSENREPSVITLTQKKYYAHSNNGEAHSNREINSSNHGVMPNNKWVHHSSHGKEHNSRGFHQPNHNNEILSNHQEMKSRQYPLSKPQMSPSWKDGDTQMMYPASPQSETILSLREDQEINECESYKETTKLVSRDFNVATQRNTSMKASLNLNSVDSDFCEGDSFIPSFNSDLNETYRSRRIESDDIETDDGTRFSIDRGKVCQMSQHDDFIKPPPLSKSQTPNPLMNSHNLNSSLNNDQNNLNNTKTTQGRWSPNQTNSNTSTDREDTIVLQIRKAPNDNQSGETHFMTSSETTNSMTSSHKTSGITSSETSNKVTSAQNQNVITSSNSMTSSETNNFVTSSNKSAVRFPNANRVETGNATSHLNKHITKSKQESISVVKNTEHERYETQVLVPHDDQNSSNSNVNSNTDNNSSINRNGDDKSYGVSRDLLDIFTTFDIEHFFQPDGEGDSIIGLCIINFHIEFVFEILARITEQTILDIPNNDGNTILHLATIVNQDVIVRRLIVLGANVIAQNIYGNTALHVACKYGFFKCACALSEPIKAPEVKYRNYYTPYQRIPQRQDILNYDGFACLHLACEFNHVNIIDHLLYDCGADVNIKDGTSGMTILHYAAIANDFALVRYLLTIRNLDLNSMRYDNATPLALARGRNNLRVMEVLKEHCAIDVDNDDVIINDDVINSGYNSYDVTITDDVMTSYIADEEGDCVMMSDIGRKVSDLHLLSHGGGAAATSFYDDVQIGGNYVG